MPLRCGIIGLAGSGKTTLFNCISNNRAETHAAAFAGSKSNLGIMNVPDARLQAIDKIIQSAKVVQTTIEMVDIPGLTKGGSQSDGNKFLADIRNVDALIHVVRCFDDPMLPHVEGSVNPVRDREIVDLELQIKDIESVEKKMIRMEKLIRAGEKDARHGLEALQKVKTHLESFQSARTAPITEEERRYLDDLFLLSDKPVMYVCNVDDNAAVNGNDFSASFIASVASEQAAVLVVAARLESDIAELETEEDRQAFLADAGLAEPGVNRLVRTAYHLLDLQCFFTAGPKEVRAWTIRKGMTAPEAAGVIHSDLERGFIRAEVMKYDDFMRYGSEHACKEHGKLMIEGKNYVVGDGDILHIRFNV
ncbi:MAG TPA: redox-regulated ATPase YchF [Bacteroidales bacterium]|nr:redox-regulated ATPase YchF [Bacteroidales bacterium]